MTPTPPQPSGVPRQDAAINPPKPAQIIAQGTLLPPRMKDDDRLFSESDPSPSPPLLPPNNPNTPTALEKKSELEKRVAEYLLDHPSFFERHRDVLARLSIPSAKGGVVSLLGKQREVMSTTITELKKTVRTIASNAEHNFARMMAIHRLQCNLLHAPTLSDMVACLMAQCGSRLGYRPLLWLWADQSERADNANITATLLRLPMATPDLIEWATLAPPLGFYPPHTPRDSSLTPWLNDEGLALMILPLRPPKQAQQARQMPDTIGLLALESPALCLTPEGDEPSHDFNDYLFAGRFAEWCARLIEGQWARQLRGNSLADTP